MPETYRFVQRRDRKSIAELAEAVRKALHLGLGRVNMLVLLELTLPDIFEGYQFLVVPDEDMPGAEGLTDLKVPTIRLPDSVYSALEAGETRARYTAAHELGHLLMHSSSHVRYARADSIDRHQDPEWQADVFAAEFLMPEPLFRQVRSVEEAMAKFGVGFMAANRRAKDLRLHLKPAKRKGHGMTRAP